LCSCGWRVQVQAFPIMQLPVFRIVLPALPCPDDTIALIWVSCLGVEDQLHPPTSISRVVDEPLMMLVPAVVAFAVDGGGVAGSQLAAITIRPEYPGNGGAFAL